MAQPGFFSRKAAETSHYPYEPLSPPKLRAIEQAIRYAWEDLNAAPQPHGIANLLDAGEVAISEALLRILAAMQTAEEPPVPAFTKEFQTPAPDGSLRNYNGEALSKRPDFCFRPKVNPRPGKNALYYAFFVEAKLVDQTGSVKPYVREGLIKFLKGDYAWAMPHAMMLAYLQQTKQALPKALVRYFSRLGNAEEFCLKSTVRLCTATRQLPRAHETVHRRTWNYPPPDNRSPGDIEIIHLWLRIK